MNCGRPDPPLAIGALAHRACYINGDDAALRFGGAKCHAEEDGMAEVKQKEQVGRRSRSVESVCKAGVRCDISAPAGNTIVTDEPAERGGNNEGASPLAHLTAALASCQTVQIVKVAEAMRFKHGAINIQASTTTDLVKGVEGNDEVMRFSDAELVIEIETDEPAQRVERLKILSEDRCPVGVLFSDAGAPPRITWEVLPMKG